MIHRCFLVLLLVLPIYAINITVDSLKIDKVWVTDSSWYDTNGLLFNRQSRDVLLSFKLSSDTACFVKCGVNISTDSGRTWDVSPNPLHQISEDTIFKSVSKDTVHLRVFGNHKNVKFKICATVTESCTPIQSPIEITYPKGGEIFKVGQEVKVSWKATPSQIASGAVVLQVSTNDGKLWKYIRNSAILCPSGQVACMSFVWKIGSEYEVIDYAPTQTVILRIGDYSNTQKINATTAQFIVNK